MDKHTQTTVAHHTSQSIADDVKDYLSKGGKIEVVPPVTHKEALDKIKKEWDRAEWMDEEDLIERAEEQVQVGDREGDIFSA